MNSFDADVLLWMNRFAGRSDGLEWAVRLLCDCEVLKGLAFVLVLWRFWMASDPDRRRRNREVIVATLAGAIVAIFLGRALATLLPFRVRPVFNPALGLRPHPWLHIGLRTWSAFPSDHAMLFAALATGICFLSPTVGVAMFVYALVVIDLPRVYLGLHHPTDIVGGAVLGTAVAWLFNTDRVRTVVSAGPLRLLETRQRLFYAALLCLSAEIVTMFAGPRQLVLVLAHVAGTGR